MIVKNYEYKVTTPNGITLYSSTAMDMNGKGVTHHRLDGPAMICAGTEFYFVNNKQLKYIDFEKHPAVLVYQGEYEFQPGDKVIYQGKDVFFVIKPGDKFVIEEISPGYESLSIKVGNDSWIMKIKDFILAPETINQQKLKKALGLNTGEENET